MPESPLASSNVDLARLDPTALLNLMIRDEDRVPREVIDACAARGEAMVEALAPVIEGPWHPDDALGKWWLRLHAAMILGRIPGERAGMLQARLLRRIHDENDDDLLDWLSGWWPMLFAEHTPPVIERLWKIAEDRGLDGRLRVEALSTVVAAAERSGPAALDEALGRVAGIASNPREDWETRLYAGTLLVDFPRERHRALVESLARRQRRPGLYFGPDEVAQAYMNRIDEPEWRRFADPWQFYEPEKIAARQARPAQEAAASGEREDEAFDGGPFETPYVRELPKIGRNEPCPCGSGKKFKKCCLDLET